VEDEVADVDQVGFLVLFLEGFGQEETPVELLEQGIEQGEQDAGPVEGV
jgi:hypothetical protein